MSTLDDALVGTRRKQGAKCSVSILLRDLPEDQAADLRAKMADPTVPSTALCRAIPVAFNGREVGIWPLQRHRRGDCDCPR